MRKRMQRRVALFLSFAMAFTSVDSSVLVAASDVTEVASEETHNHEEELSAPVTEESLPGEEVAEDTEAPTGEQELDVIDSDELILVDEEAVEEEQILGEEPAGEAEPETETAIVEEAEIESETTAETEKKKIQFISAVSGRTRPFILRVDNYISDRTILTITYTDGETYKEDLYNSAFTDPYGNYVKLYLADTSDDSKRYTVYQSAIAEGTYELECDVDGTIWKTGVVYQVVTLEHANLPTLETGTVEIHTSANEWAWYQFTAPADGTYGIGTCNSMQVYKAEDGELYGVGSKGRNFEAEKDVVYYVGFGGPVYNPETKENEYSWTTTFSEITKEIKGITVTSEAEDLYYTVCENEWIPAGLKYQITYSDNTTEDKMFESGSTSYSENGQSVAIYLKKEDNEEDDWLYGDWNYGSKFAEGNYVVKFMVDSQTALATDSVVHVVPVNEINARELTTGENEIYSDETGKISWYRFTAPETGEYVLNNFPQMFLYDEDGTYVSRDNGWTTLSLEKNKTYYLGFVGKVDQSSYWTLNLTSKVRITGVTNVVPEKTEYVQGSGWVGDGTNFELTYSDASTWKGTVNGNGFSDDFGNYVQIRLIRESDGKIYEFWNVPPEGQYALQFTVNSEVVAQTDYLYHMTGLASLVKGDLVVGENEISTSDDWNNRSWYRFEAKADGKYTIEKCNSISVYEETESGVEWIVSRGRNFSLKEGKNYYIGFSGAVQDPDTGKMVYNWTTAFGLVEKEIKSIELVSSEDQYYATCQEERVPAGLEYRITYSDGSTEDREVEYYQNNIAENGDAIAIYMGNKEANNWMGMGGTCEEGDYAVKFIVDDQTILITDQIVHVVPLSELPARELEVGENTIRSNDTGRISWYKFVVPEDGMYTLRGFTELYLYDAAKEDDYEEYYDVATIDAEKDHVYYLGFRRSWNGNREWTATLSQNAQITGVTGVIPERTEYVQGSNQSVGHGTRFTLVYSDGTTYDGTFNSGSITDDYDNEISIKLKKQDDETSYSMGSYLPEGMYALQFSVGDRIVAVSPYLYKVVGVDSVCLGDLTEGENSITSSIDWNNPNWYRFTATTTGRYYLDKVNSVRFLHKTENGVESANYSGRTFKVTEGEVYYIGFVGGVTADDGYLTYEWTVNLAPALEITGITFPDEEITKYAAGLSSYIHEGTHIRVAYGEETKDYTLDNSAVFSDMYGNALSIDLVNSEKERFSVYDTLPKGKYVLRVWVNGVTYTSDELYELVDPSEAGLPKIENVGTVSLISGKDASDKKWYQFTAPKSGTYQFRKVPSMEVRYETEDGMKTLDSEYGIFDAEEGTTYYIGFYYSLYDSELEENVYAWTTELRIIPSVSNITVEPDQTKFWATEGESQNYVYVKSITFHYDNETSATFTDWDELENVDGMGNGVKYYLTSHKEGDDEEYYYYNSLEAGTYTVHVQYLKNSDIEATYDITVEEEPTPFNGKASVTELVLGKKYTVRIDENTPSGWFSYTPQEKIPVIFASTGNRDTYGCIYDVDGEMLDSNDDAMDMNFGVSYTLEAGKTYYLKARLLSTTQYGRFSVWLREKQSIQSLEVIEHNLKPYYLSGTGVRNLNISLKATYSDNSSETFDEYSSDSYGNSVEREYLDASGKVTYNTRNIGTYTCQIRYGEADDQVVEVGKFQVVSVEEYVKQVVTEDEEQELDAAEDSVMKYQFTVKDAGIYQLNANVPFKNLKVYDKEQSRVELSRQTKGYTGYATLQPGTYYVVADLDSLITKLRVSVTKAILPTKVTASVSKTTLIAGVDRLEEANLTAKLEYTDDTTGWIYGEAADAYGNCVSYDVTDEQEGWSINDTLPVGTYTVEPVVFRTGTYRRADNAADNEALHEVLKKENINSLQIEVVKPDVSSMTAIKENEYVAVSGNSRRQFFTFTPETDGTYTFEYDRERMGATAQFYKNLPKYLSSYGEVLDARAGQTYVVVADRYTDYQFRVVKQGTGTTITKQIQQAEIIANKGYCTETSGYEVRNQMYLLITYADGTTATLDVPWIIDGSSCDTSDDYGNTFKVDLDSFEEITKDDRDYLRVTVYCGDLTITKDIPYATIQEKAIEVTTKEAVTAEKSAYFKFIPEETGEYIFCTAASESVDIDEFKDGTRIYNKNGYGSENMVYQFATAYLKKGRTYYFDINLYRDNNVTTYTLTVTKVEKQVTDLKITGIPEGLVAYEGIGLTDYNWLQAEATYSDGTKETVTQEMASETGRGLSLYRTYWLNTKTFRVEVEYGKYRAHADFPAKAWDYTGEIKLGTAASSATDKLVNLFSFTPDESGTYQFVTRGIRQYGVEVYDSDTHQTIYSWYGIYDLEAGQKYDLAVYCYNDAETTFTITAYKEGEIAEEHEHKYVDQTKSATCTEPGYTQKVCSICGAVLEGSRTEIPALGHNLTKTESKEATCTEAGNKAYWTCATCGKVYVDENATAETTVKEQQIAALGHRLTKTEAKEATCTESGNHEYWTCQACGKVYADENGKTETTVEDQVIAALGHKLTKTEAKEATCTETGNHEYWTCTTCKKVFSDAEGTIETTAEAEVIAATGHKLMKVEAKDSTCEAAGNHEYWTCVTCGKVYADENATAETTVKEQQIAALGHNLTKVEGKEATCTESGNNEYWICATCGKAFADEKAEKATTAAAEVISPLGHVGSVRVTKEATETEEGIQETYCTTCGTVLKTETIPMLGHRMGDWIITKEPTCTEEGSQYRECVYDKCTICTDGNRYRQEGVIPATGHKLKMVDEKAATCTKAGNHAYWICQTCGKVYTSAEAQTETTIKEQVINATGHNYGEWQTTTAAKCEQAGEMTRTCATCRNTEKTDIPATGHHFVSERLEPTCTSAGYVREKCTDCEKVKAGSYESLALLGHDYDEWVVVKKVTCTDSGEQTKTCRRCGNVDRMTLNTTGHWYDKEEKAATCTEAGYTREKCRICGDIKNQTDIPATGHQYKDERQPATCAKDGYSQKVCSTCGKISEYKVIPATGHQYDDTWTVEKEATCTEEGAESRTCKNCDNKETRVVPKTDHTWVKDIIKEATATEEGLEREICDNCETERLGSRIIIPKIGHQMGEWTETKAATCTETGTRTRKCEYNKCTLCNGVPYEQTESIPALGHDWNSVEEKATCIKDGYVQQICKTCGASGECIVIPATGHSFGEGKYVKEPTCTSQGLMVFTCTKEDCSAKRYGILPKSKHTWNAEATIEKAATCTSKGMQDIRCSICNEVKEGSETEIPSTSHSWNSKLTIDRQPTCTETGSQSRHCVTCDAINPSSVEIIPATGHDFETSRVPATCTTSGTKTSQCKVCGIVETESIPATGHDMQLDMSLSTMRTCNSDGLLVYVCQNTGCGQRRYEIVSAYDRHDWGEVQEKSATETENGKKYQICKRCGEENVVEIILRNSQKEVIDQVLEGDITAILDVDNEVLLSDTHKGLIKKVEDEITTNGVNGKTYQTRISGNMTDGSSSVTGATITAAAEEMRKASASVVALAMDDVTLYTESSNIVTSEVTVNKTKDETLDMETGKYYIEMSVSMTVDGKAMVSLEKPIDVTVKAPDSFQDTICTLKDENGTEQTVTIAADGTLSFTTETLGRKQLIKVSCAGEHTYKLEAKETPATCTDPKKISRTCTKCNYVKEETAGEAKGHSYEVERTIQAATCTTEGSQAVKCKDCQNETTRPISATGHKYEGEYKVTLEPTCTTEGRKERSCSNPECTEKDVRVIPATGHHYADNYTRDTDPTCTEVGSESRHCTNAGCDAKTDSRTIEALGHKFDVSKAAWDNTSNSDECLQTGTVTCENANCGNTQTVSRGNHALKKTDKKAATCTEAGNNEYWTCEKCNTVFADASGNTETTVKEQTIPANGHSMTPTPAKAANCVSEGTKGYWTCDTCGKVFADANGTTETTVAAQVIAKGGHNLKQIPAKEATCVTEGTRGYWTCDTCGKVFADQNGTTETTVAAQVIAKSGHKLTQTPAKAATCVAEGTRGYWTCGTCGKVFADQAGTIETTVASQVLGKVAHTMGGYVETVHPTALAAGVKTHTCSVCGYAESAEVAKLVSNVKLTTSKLPLQIKQKAALSKIVTGMAEGDYIASAASANKKIATVDNKGNVKGVKAGKTTVTLNFASGTSRTVTIVVQKKKVATSKLTVSERNVTLKVKGKRTLMALISPITSKDKVTYKTSNKKVATVSKKGVITAKKAGKAVITVKAGKKTVKVKVKVTK